MKLLITLTLLISITFAWDGYDPKTDSYIKTDFIGSIKKGSVIQYTDNRDNIEREGKVKKLNGNNLEIIDKDTREIRRFVME